MAESVEEELRRKLEGATNALIEVDKIIERYRSEREVLAVRVRDLKLALIYFDNPNVPEKGEPHV